MSFKRTAVVVKRNLLGKRIRGRLPMEYLRGMSRDEILNHLDAGWMLPLAGGATSPTNQALENPVYFPRAIVVTSDQTINQGDLVWWDPINYTLKALSATSQVAVGAAGGFCGAAAGTANPNVYPDPAAGTPSEHLPGIVVQRGGTVTVNTTVGDTSYFPFEPVTLGADAQTVTRGGQTSANRVGFIIVAPPVTARAAPGATPAPETLAAGTRANLWLEPKFPDSALL